MRPVAASSNTDAALTGVTPGPVTMKVAAFTVDGSIRVPEGTEKVALTLALGQTPDPPVAGVVELTVTLATGAAETVVKVHT